MKTIHEPTGLLATRFIANSPEEFADKVVADHFLDELYDIADITQPEDGLDYIFFEMDALLRGSEFQKCNQILEMVNIDNLPIVHVLALVTITNAAREKLPYRAEFVAKIRALLGDDAEKQLLGIE